VNRWMPWVLIGVLLYLATRKSAPKGTLGVAGAGPATGGQARPSSTSYYPGSAPSTPAAPPPRSFATLFNMSVAQGKSPLGGKP